MISQVPGICEARFSRSHKHGVALPCFSSQMRDRPTTAETQASPWGELSESCSFLRLGRSLWGNKTAAWRVCVLTALLLQRRRKTDKQTKTKSNCLRRVLQGKGRLNISTVLDLSQRSSTSSSLHNLTHPFPCIIIPILSKSRWRSQRCHSGIYPDLLTSGLVLFSP